MTILAYILSYLFIGLICCVIVTYLDTKHKWSYGGDNLLPFVSFFIWPISIPLILFTVFGFGLNSAINKLRKLFDE